LYSPLISCSCYPSLGPLRIRLFFYTSPAATLRRQKSPRAEFFRPSFVLLPRFTVPACCLSVLDLLLGNHAPQCDWVDSPPGDSLGAPVPFLVVVFHLPSRTPAARYHLFLLFWLLCLPSLTFCRLFSGCPSFQPIFSSLLLMRSSRCPITGIFIDRASSVPLFFFRPTLNSLPHCWKPSPQSSDFGLQLFRYASRIFCGPRRGFARLFCGRRSFVFFFLFFRFPIPLSSTDIPFLNCVSLVLFPPTFPQSAPRGLFAFGGTFGMFRWCETIFLAFFHQKPLCSVVFTFVSLPLFCPFRTKSVPKPAKPGLTTSANWQHF